ncbi:hypothetical protein [Pelobacter seleniigenes]|uniref:hypothetical protein n=1 Tax=Pelobacter seleniigenes TaxID=407188 RepID=UPI0004A713E0|nr:hypothetical protein [Pelobacter seleniigenes]
MFKEKKVMFWPVGTGDCTSIVLAEDVVLQVDMRCKEENGDQEGDGESLVDIFEENLPEVGGKPYLAGFALTHPDKDHVEGFADLLSRVDIGEIWFTPRVFAENDTDLCDDAVAFKEEAERRVNATIKCGGDVASGDRVRLIGYDQLLEEDTYKGFPRERLTIPGNSINELDGEDYTGEFNAFIHAPFAEQIEGDRNNTSLCMQVTFSESPDMGGVLLFGDIAYPRIRKIFDTTKNAKNEEYLAWKVFLAPHHCSKSAMYQKDGDREVLKQDMLDDLDSYQVLGGVIVASCDEIPARNQSGDNPPHAKAKQRYEEIAEGGFLCTQEDTDGAEPIVFLIQDDGSLERDSGSDSSEGRSSGNLSAAVKQARGSDAPPSEKVGYGG